MAYFQFEPNLMAPSGGAFQISRYVDDTEQQLELEERALNNYLNEVKNIHSSNFIYNPSLNPVKVNMYLNPNHYMGEVTSRCQAS